MHILEHFLKNATMIFQKAAIYPYSRTIFPADGGKTSFSRSIPAFWTGFEACIAIPGIMREPPQDRRRYC